MLALQPLTLREAYRFIAQHHRHHKAPQGAKFAIGCNDGKKVVGVIIVGRPVARSLDDTWTAEVTRCCTDGTKNAPSKLYALIGFNDTPGDALYRLETIYSMGSLPNPMRYQPLNAIKRNSYVNIAAGWTHQELTRFMRYWTNCRYLRSVPFVKWHG